MNDFVVFSQSEI